MLQDIVHLSHRHHTTSRFGDPSDPFTCSPPHYNLSRPLSVFSCHSTIPIKSPLNSAIVPSRLVPWVVRPSHTSASQTFVDIVSHSHTLTLRPFKSGPFSRPARALASQRPALVMDSINPTSRKLTSDPIAQASSSFRIRGRNGRGPAELRTISSSTFSARCAV